MTDHDRPDHIPPLLPPDQMPPIVDQASLEDTWRRLMGRLGFSRPQLWLLFIDGDRSRHVVNVEDVPLHPTTAELDGVRSMLDHIIDDRRSCAVLYARPGGPARTPGDLAWARGLAAATGGGWPVHLANDIELRVAAPDDLAASA